MKCPASPPAPAVDFKKSESDGDDDNDDNQQVIKIIQFTNTSEMQ